MKLINPTDDELNAAFAEKVAGWRRHPIEKGGGRDKSHYLLAPKTTEWGLGFRGIYILFWKDGTMGGDSSAINFTRSADAVLPWLDKHGWTSDNSDKQKNWVRIWGNGGEAVHYIGEDKSFPRAAVIALLLAHGVEVEFTS